MPPVIYRFSQWNCRPTGSRQGGPARRERGYRDASACTSQRFLLYAAQDGLCPCGSPIDHEKPSLDHVIPRSLGGPDKLGNLLVMHAVCNGRKSNDIPTGCELVWLLAVNAKLGVEPVRW